MTFPGRFADSKELRSPRKGGDDVALDMDRDRGVCGVALSLLMGLIIGRILRVIGREVSELLEAGSPHTRVTLSPVRALETEIVRSRPKELVTN